MSKIKAPRTTQCDRLAACAEKRNAIMEFFEWLEYRQPNRNGKPMGDRLFLARYPVRRDGSTRDDPVPHHEPIETLLLRFLNISGKRLENQRRALLEYQRRLNDAA